MKVFCFIFTIYILFLSFQPCEEMTTSGGLKLNGAATETELKAAARADEKGDDCSPFCICSCCHFSTAYQFKTFSITSKITTSVILRTNFSYQNPYSQAFQNAIWQPPKFNSAG